MKMVCYNIAKCSQDKINHVLCMGADLYILPECADTNNISLPTGYGMLWTGDDDLPQKGLGVIWKEPLAVQTVKEYRKIKHHLPLIVDDGGCQRFILACWPTVWKEAKTYPQLLLEILREYSSYLDKLPSLAIGDFNCYIGQRGVRKKTGTFEDCIRNFESHGMKSAYHTRSNEEFGKEHEATFFWRYDEHSPYFLDYTFSNAAIQSYEVGQWEKAISDYRPQIMEL